LEWLFQDNKEDLLLIKNDDINKKLINSLIEVLQHIALS